MEVNVSKIVQDSNADGLQNFNLLKGYLDQVGSIKSSMVEKGYQNDKPLIYNYCIVLEIKILQLMKKNKLTNDDVKELQKELKTLANEALKNAGLGDFIKDKNAEFQKQRDAIPKWKTGKFLSKILPESKLKSIKQKFNKVKQVLKKAQTLLKSARSFVSILSKILSVITSPLNSALKSLVDELRRIVDNAKGTGVYFLETASYVYKGPDWFMLSDDATRPSRTKDEEAERFRDYLNQNNMVTDAILQNPYNQLNIEDNNASSKSLGSQIGDSLGLSTAAQEQIAKIKDFMQYSFLKMTYEDFIQLIADAFVDVNDNPTGVSLLAELSGQQENSFIGNARGQASTVNGKLNMSTITKDDTKSTRYNLAKNVLKSGSPKWGAGVSGKVTILALNFNDFSDLSTAIGGLSNFCSAIKSNYNSVSSKDKTLKQILSDATDSAIDSINPGNVYDKLKNLFDTNSRKNLARTIPDFVGEDPNFLGMTFFQLFPILFNSLEILLGELDSFIESAGKFKFLSDLDKLLESIDNFLLKIENFIDLVDALVSALESIFKISFQVLSFNFVDGVDNIYDKLLAAENHPYANTGDPLIYIGLVFAYNTSLGAGLDTKKMGEQFAAAQDNTLRDINDEIKGDPAVPKSFKKLLGGSGKNITNDVLGGF